MLKETKQLDSLRVMLEDHGMPSVYRPGRGKALRISVTVTDGDGKNRLAKYQKYLRHLGIQSHLYSLPGVGERWYRLKVKGAKCYAQLYKLIYEGVPFEHTVEHGKRAITVRVKYVEGLRRILDESKNLQR